MTDQLLWLETLLKGGIGLVMLIAPVSVARLAGLPHGNGAFWPRLFGAALVGLAGAFAFEGYARLNAAVTAHGIGLAGAVIINLVTTLALVGTLIFKSVATRRGRLFIWAIGAVLLFLMLFEIAHA